MKPIKTLAAVAALASAMASVASADTVVIAQSGYMTHVATSSVPLALYSPISTTVIGRTPIYQAPVHYPRYVPIPAVPLSSVLHPLPFPGPWCLSCPPLRLRHHHLVQPGVFMR